MSSSKPWLMTIEPIYGIAIGAGTFGVLVILVCVLYYCFCKPKDEEEDEEDQEKKRSVKKKKRIQSSSLSVTSITTVTPLPSPKQLRYVNTEKKINSPPSQHLPHSQEVSLANKW